MTRYHESWLAAPSKHTPYRPLYWILAGRLVVATILLGATTHLTLDSLAYRHFTPSALPILISVIYGSSIFFSAWLRRGADKNHVAVAITTIDLVLITVLVYLTGASGSIFSFLYGAEIMTAALTLGTSAAHYTAAASLSLYVVFGVTVHFGWTPLPSDQPMNQVLMNSRDLLLALVTNTVGIAAVALLAGNLARRAQWADSRLAKAQQHAASLVRLNDDIVRSIASGLITVNEEGRILGANPAAKEILRDQAESLVGQPISTVLPSYCSQTPNAPPKQAEAIGKRADGSEFPIGFTLSTLLNADDRPFGLLLAFQDLTEIKMLRDRAERTQRLAALGQLATGLAHEIRNPLNAISGSVEMVCESNALGSEDARLLGIVLSEVHRLNSLVTTMLQVGHPSRIQMHMLDLRCLVTEVVAIARGATLNSTELNIVETVPSEPLFAPVDPDRMRQVLWNLVKNGMQVSPYKGTVAVSAGRDRSGRAFLEVADDGPGVDITERDRLFDMFYSGRPHGVGIGLALAKQIVDQHNGRLEFFDKRRGGSRFRVTFPDHQVSIKPHAEAPQAEPLGLGNP